jgi:NADH-quinone oxidoreductase subunit N
MGVGALGGLRQRRWKRLLAYSSITNAGFMLIVLSTSTLLGLRSLLFYLVVYTITTTLLFVFLIEDDHDFFGDLVSGGGYLTDLPRSPILILLLFSMGGLPPLLGFFTKYAVYVSIVGSQFWWAIGPVLLFHIISFFYYVRLVKITFFTAYRKGFDSFVNRTLISPSSIFRGFIAITLVVLLPYFGDYLLSLFGWFTLLNCNLL